MKSKFLLAATLAALTLSATSFAETSGTKTNVPPGTSVKTLPGSDSSINGADRGGAAGRQGDETGVEKTGPMKPERNLGSTTSAEPGSGSPGTASITGESSSLDEGIGNESGNGTASNMPNHAAQ